MKNPQAPADLRQLFLATGQYGIDRGNQLEKFLWVKKDLRTGQHSGKLYHARLLSG